MELKAYFAPIRKWWWLILLATLVAGGTSYFMVSQQEPVYRSHTTLLIGSSINNPNPTGNEFWLSQQLAQTYTDIVQREVVQEAVMSTLGLTWLPSYSAQTVPNTQLIEIAVTDTIPERAMVVANELARQLILQTPTSGQQEGDRERQEFIRQQLDELQVKIRETNDEIVAKQEELAGLFSARQLADTQNQISALEAKLDTLQSNYAALLASTSKGAVNTLTVIEPATLPRNPIGPETMITVFTAAAIGLALALGAAYLLEYLDDTIRSPEDISKVLGLPVVGIVVQEPAIEKSEGIPYVTANPRSPMTESFRTLRTNMEFASVDRPLKTILVTSPGSSEGKTTVATNLAAIMAQANKRVILLEADLRRPRVHRALGMTNQIGISDVFRGQADIRDVARYSKVKDLAVITSGSLPPNPAELLGSARMVQILSRLTESASTVIIDSPPFLVTDATVLSARVDGVLLVIQPGRTHAEAARAMVAQLNRAGARVVGVVLNRVPRKNAGYYGYYRYDSDSLYSIENAPAEPAASAAPRRVLGGIFGGRKSPGKIGEEITQPH